MYCMSSLVYCLKIGIVFVTFEWVIYIMLHHHVSTVVGAKVTLNSKQFRKNYKDKYLYALPSMTNSG